MKYQFLFSLKNKEKYLGMPSAAVVIGALRVKTHKGFGWLVGWFWV